MDWHDIRSTRGKAPRQKSVRIRSFRGEQLHPQGLLKFLARSRSPFAMVQYSTDLDDTPFVSFLAPLSAKGC